MTSITYFFIFLFIYMPLVFGFSQLDDTPISSYENQPLSNPIAGNLLVPVFSFKINNNTPQGFYLKFKSLNQGRFIRYSTSGYASHSIPGNVVPYTISLVPSNQGSLGLEPPPEMNNISLSTDTSLFFYKNASNSSTIDYRYVLKISSNPTRLAFKGSFKDTLSIEIIDL